MKKYQIIKCKEASFPKGTLVCRPRLLNGQLLTTPLWAGLQRQPYETAWSYLGEIRVPGSLPYAVVVAVRGYKLERFRELTNPFDLNESNERIVVQLDEVMRTLLVPMDRLKDLKRTGAASMPTNPHVLYFGDDGSHSICAEAAVKNAKLHLQDRVREQANQPIKFS